MMRDRITYDEFKHFVKKYYEQCVELGEEVSMMTREEVKTIILGNVKSILNKEP